MSDYGNLWKEALEGEKLNTTKNVVPLLEQQCKNLSESTDGKVCAHFAPVGQTAAEAIRGVVRAFTDAESMVHPEWDDGRQNANSLYAPERYSFDIRTDTYRFRLFELRLQPVYPISITFDEGVYNEAKDQLRPLFYEKDDGCRVQIEDDDDLMRCVGVAIRTRKVRYILQRLLEQAEDSDAVIGGDES